ncbi:MAG TPA: carbohydrate-binding protein [Blastocatellia bacterium]|nr:carbohydrate-binding protein [Blastocatellia bacterium]
MRKRLITVSQNHREPDQKWLDLDKIATIELTSEATAYPIEEALLPGGDSGWRADSPGEQVIRIVFDHPQSISRIWLSFKEPDIERTQEFVLRWSSDHGKTYREIVRQQWNFSRSGAIREVEDYRVNLTDVTTIELHIVPSTEGGDAHASLSQLRLA